MSLKEMLYELKEIWETNLLSSDKNSKDYHYCKGALFIIETIIVLLPLLKTLDN